MPRSPKLVCDPVEAVIADIRAGRMVIVTDDEDRENEGDLICAAEKITPEIMVRIDEVFGVKKEEDDD